MKPPREDRTERLARRLLESREIREHYLRQTGERDELETLARLSPVRERAPILSFEWALRQPRWALAAAAALLLAVLPLLWGPFRSFEGGPRDLNDLLANAAPGSREQAVARLLQGPAGPEQGALLAQLQDENPAWAFLARDPFAPATWSELDRQLGRPRAGDDEYTPEALRSPRGGVAEAAPAFAFEEAVLEGRERRYFVTIEPTTEGADRTHTLNVRQAADASGPLRASLPEGERLLVGVEYRWSVSLDPDVHPEHAPFYRPRPATFRVVERSVLDAALAASTGRLAWDVLLAAAELASAGLHEAALERLGALPGDAFSEERAAALVLEAAAFAQLGFEEEFEASHRELRALAQSLGR